MCDINKVWPDLNKRSMFLHMKNCVILFWSYFFNISIMFLGRYLGPKEQQSVLVSLKEEWRTSKPPPPHLWEGPPPTLGSNWTYEQHRRNVIRLYTIAPLCARLSAESPEAMPRKELPHGEIPAQVLDSMIFCQT